MNTLHDLLEVEQKQKIWDEDIRGLHLWTTLRSHVMIEVVSRRKKLQEGHLPEGRLARIQPKLFSYHAATLSRLLLAPRKPVYDALIFKKARNYNIYRYYYERIPHALILDESWKNNISTHAWETQETALMDTLTLMSSVGRRFVKLTAAEEAQIRDFVQHVTQVYDLPDKTDLFYGHTKRSVQAAVVMRRLLNRHVIPRLHGKMALVHQAYYMTKFAVLTQTLRQAGIKVVELQHGVIYSGHVAYMYPQQAVNDPQHPVHLYKPDLFLTFGDFWADQITIPGKSQTIGYPHLIEKVKAHAHQKDEKHVLLVSQGTVSQRLADVTEKLAKVYPDYTFIYKLHPEEIGFADRYSHIRQLKNVKVVDYLSDVHEFLGQCEIVIGLYSTVLFEAVAYPNRRIFILAHDFFEDDIMTKLGTVFTSADELIAMFEDETKGRTSFEPDHFWQSNWEARLQQFYMEFTEGV